MFLHLNKQLVFKYARFYSSKTLVQLDNATVYSFGRETPSFRNLSLTIKNDQRLVIVGPVSSGKTTLAETIAGKHSIQPISAGKWPIVNKSISPYVSDYVHLVSFREESGAFSYSKHYYQERFNFSDPDNDITLQAYLESANTGNQTLEKEKIKEVAKQLNIDDLLHLSFVKLSNGQTRRARIARELLRNPSMLVLDEPLMGLDIEHRKSILAVLKELQDKSLIPVVLVLRPQDEIPVWATDIVELDNMGIKWTGKPEEYIRRRDGQRQPKQEHEWIVDDSNSNDPVIEMHDCMVTYSGKPILQNINWTVRKGDRWVLLGPNGSGKTTLLSFLTGDHPQAYANDLSLFGRRRGTGESIWEIKKKIGLVSPEVHLYFDQSMSGMEAAGTGFFDVVVPQLLNDEHKKKIRELFDEFGISFALDRKLREMSTGEQRMVLLVRSLVKGPELIIWDEPFQGLDETKIGGVNRWLEKHMSEDQTLIMVTHHEEEIPRTVNKRLRLGSNGVQID